MSTPAAHPPPPLDDAGRVQCIGCGVRLTPPANIDWDREFADVICGECEMVRPPVGADFAWLPRPDATCQCCWTGDACLFLHTDPGTGLRYFHFRADPRTTKIDHDGWKGGLL